jgi:hypothetical protein
MYNIGTNTRYNDYFGVLNKSQYLVALKSSYALLSRVRYCADGRWYKICVNPTAMTHTYALPNVRLLSESVHALGALISLSLD